LADGGGELKAFAAEHAEVAEELARSPIKTLTTEGTEFHREGLETLGGEWSTTFA
jgi:hypothetical protein